MNARIIAQYKKVMATRLNVNEASDPYTVAASRKRNASRQMNKLLDIIESLGLHVGKTINELSSMEDKKEI